MGTDDAVADGLADFTLTRAGRSSPASRREAARRLLDVYGLALESRDDRAVRIARSLARARPDGVSVWGVPGRYDLPGAVLANCVGARYRDANDAYFNRESLHPSDMIPALCAVAEECGADTGALLDAVCVAYDVAVDMADIWRTSSRGADHVNLIRFGTVAGAGLLRTLSRDGLASAFAIAATTQVATRQTRRGNLTMWKGYAAGDHAVGGLRAVDLAAAGVEGPTQAFVGEMGFQNLAVDPATHVEAWPFSGAESRIPRILDTHVKVYPVGYLSQAAAETAIDLHHELGDDQPVSVRIATYARAAEIMADAEKWAPTSPETADHSLPYIVTVGLLDGVVDIDSMAQTRYSAPDVRRLLAQVEVAIDPDMTSRYPDEMAIRVEVTAASGEVRSRLTPRPLGHAKRPLTDEEMRLRSIARVEPVLGDRAEALVAGMTDPDETRPAAALWTTCTEGDA